MTDGHRRFDRRQLLRYLASSGAAMAAGPVVAGCARAGPSTGSRPRVERGSPPWAQLASAMSGRLVLPADPGYLASAQLYNERFDTARPAAVAYCQSASDVQRAVEFSRGHDVPLSVRSGGHSYGGYSVGTGLVIDVTPMAGVAVDGTGARIGAGARLVDVYANLASSGRAIPAGSCPTVGIAGLALGGGIGVLGRKFGLTCDTISSLEIVSADSRVLTASATDNPDLFWASRGGGGGNFGVVTSFQMDTVAVPELSLFTLEWPWAAATEVLAGWQTWMQAAPNELWSNCQLLSKGAAGTQVKVTGVYCGDAASLSGRLAPLVSEVGAPSYRFVGPEPFMRAMLIEAGCEGRSVAQCHLPSQDPAGVLERSAFSTKSLFIDEPLPSSASVAVVEAVSRFNEQAPGFGGAAVFDSYGGAIAEVPESATAFVHRNALADIEMNVSWSGPPSSPVPGPALTWLGQLADTLGPHSSGAYVNYIDPTLADWETAYYGSNLPRLQRVKRAADPDDVFRFAQSIPVGA